MQLRFLQLAGTLFVITNGGLICFLCSHSDDNILRNIELFDKLSLRFSERILFVKDVLVSNEICLWSFYGNGQKIVDVDCTSIVYGQDKKHTKVSQINETFNELNVFRWVHTDRFSGRFLLVCVI